MNSIVKNWNLIRSFLEVYRQGSLSAAARSLGVSQPTLTRDIQSLETDTGLHLFHRTTKGLVLTEQGENLVEAAEKMGEAADSFSRMASGLSEELVGTVRVSANEIVGIYLLPKIITGFRKLYPGVQVELVISNQVSSLNKREADLALRMFKPNQPDLVCRRMADMELGFYAHRDYLRENGVPKRIEDLHNHELIGEDLNREFIDGAERLGYTFTERDFSIRTDHLLAQIAVARAGGGIVGLHKQIAKQWHELQQVLSSIVLPKLECWLVCHRDVQYNSNMRALMRYIGDNLSQDAYKELLV